MNFYGSVGYIMAGSGIQSLLELIYAEHTVPHIFFAKAFTRATRAPPLNWLLCRKRFNIFLISDMSFETREQHKALLSTLMKKDYPDAMKIL